MSNAEAAPAPEPLPVAAAPKKSGLMGLVIGLVFMLAVAGGETAIGYLCVPNLAVAAAAEDGEEAEAEASHGAAEADAHGGGHGDGHGDAHAAPALPSDPDAIVEYDLGSFHLQTFQPISNTTQYMDFHLYGTLRAGDHAEFSALYTQNQHRLRDQIIATIRNSDADDMADPGLGLIKRRVLKKSNDLLGKPLLTAIVVSEFTFLEQ
ncbi:MAG: hypothetical protein K1X74_15340 [Pirellulales bacterium]|nr:hypothetical protein [Pirellulales bacterium]